MDLLTQIAVTDADHISDVVSAAIQRYRELFPDWDIFFFSLPKNSSRTDQINLQISLLQQLKERGTSSISQTQLAP